LQRRSIYVAGVVMVGTANKDNRDAIAQYGAVPVLGEMSMFDPLTPDRLEAWASAEFDRGNHLLEMMR
jgi:hypothetical protein